VAALAQAEAALELFRAQNNGHLVLISSMSAVRGLPRSLTTYAASKAALCTLGEGIRADLLDSPITVSTILPGYIRSEINVSVKNTPLIIDTDTGCRLLARAIEGEPARAIVPAWPWRAMDVAMRMLPLRTVARFA
jgi:NAD(P)-dependent dehydrogenase (short-subunit alcohol dehydrogenase family)